MASMEPELKFKVSLKYLTYSFASFMSNEIEQKGKSIYNIKIQGQICHVTPNTLKPDIHKTPKHSQFYIYDDQSAVEKRLNTNNNKKLIQSHIETLTKILKNNPIAKNYKHLHQIANIQNLPNYKMIFLLKNGQQKHVYNKPLTAECGAIIVSDSGLPENYDLCVYPKELPENHPQDTYLNKLSQFVDPMVFPLLFPSDLPTDQTK
ncbi:hypothetical protein TSAR_006687 [Trichomalopsis sarcophagae]|uniref:Uncharacterized protein n=1 Tax=Trichomalopsis sarcophagae TaxID=543379 RepID=A0A232EDP2_9HYME|nr:hypothetical protein TSAR_006687 [Trichomalopsis sarcophagae]